MVMMWFPLQAPDIPLHYAMHMFDRHLQVRIDGCGVIPDVDVMGSFVFHCIF